MEKKILLAVDGTQKGSSALSVMGKILKDRDDLSLVVFHCVQQLSRLLPGELCLDVEQSCRLPFSDQEKVGSTVLNESKRILMEAGVPEHRIQTELKLDSMDPAQDVLSKAEALKIQTVALGRHGRSQLESLLLGSVSSKVAQYAQHRSVWIVDTPVHESNKVLVAMEGVPDSRTLTYYTSEFLAPTSQLQYTFLHLMPPVPPTFWDDGHILAPSEQKDRQARIEKWRADWIERVEKFMDEARGALAARGVSENSIETLILPTKEGIARDLLNEIAEHEFQIVVMGKRSFHERKPFLMGSHANKILQSVKGTILCLVDT
jgi:nucleotide-binding universal stress UspA family protein